MKVKLILPALTEATSPFWRPIKYSLFPPLGLATLAGYLDENDEITLQDEHVETLDLDDQPDLVVIQVYITNANRAYRLADHYRGKGAYVCLGGLHVTALPEEAAAHADSIFLGPGEDTWPAFLRDYRAGCPQKRYISSERTLQDLPKIRRDLIKRPLYLVPNSLVVSRGCPHHCDFCYKEVLLRRRQVLLHPLGRPGAGRDRQPARVATCSSWTTTCSATRASPPGYSTACAAWGGSGRLPGRSGRSCSRVCSKKPPPAVCAACSSASRRSTPKTCASSAKGRTWTGIMPPPSAACTSTA